MLEQCQAMKVKEAEVSLTSPHSILIFNLGASSLLVSKYFPPSVETKLKPLPDLVLVHVPHHISVTIPYPSKYCQDGKFREDSIFTNFDLHLGTQEPAEYLLLRWQSTTSGICKNSTLLAPAYLKG